MRTEELHVSRWEFGLMTEKVAELARMGPDGEVDGSAFVEWAMWWFGLRPHTGYTVVVDYPGRARQK